MTLIAVVALSTVAGATSPESGPVIVEIPVPLVDAEFKAQGNVLIAHGAVGAPIGFFLLVRRGNDACAIRFTQYRRDRKGQQASDSSEGGESLYASYDWFHQADGSGDFLGVEATSGHATLARKPLVGVGRLAFQTGTTLLKCGPFSLWWQAQTAVSFYSGMRPNDEGVELAPTKWRDVSEIDIRDPRIKWYRYDKKRAITYVPINDLW